MKKWMTFLCILLLCSSQTLLSVSAAPAKSVSSTPRQTQITVRAATNFKTESDVKKFVQLASKYKISVIYLNVKQDEDDEVPSGYVYYKSKIAPIAKGYRNFDVLKSMIKEAHKKSIKVYAWVPQFHDRAALKKYPNAQMKTLVGKKTVAYNQNGEYFVNPLNKKIQKYEISILKEIAKKYDVDGIILDWLRFDDYKMDLSKSTRNAFKKKYGYDPITISFSTNNAKRRQWNSWRTSQLASYVKQASRSVRQTKKDILLGVFILTPEFTECGQDVGKFKSYIDVVLPMSYYKDWDFTPSWVYGKNSGILYDTQKKAKNTSIIPTFDLPSSTQKDSYKTIFKKTQKNYPKIKCINYFIYGKWKESHFKKIVYY